MWGNGFGCGLGEFGGFGWAGMLFGGLTMLLFWGGLLVLIFLAIRSFGRPKSDHSGWKPTRDQDSGSRALEALKERYARGEIGKEEYDDILQNLMA